MRLSTLSTIAWVTGALAFPPALTLSTLSYQAKRSLSTGAPQAPNPTSAPVASSSVTFEGPYTLPSKPTECTDSSIPFETSVWVHGNQLTVEDSTGSGSWITKDKSDWTFSTNTSGIVFGSPYFPAGGGCARGQPCPKVANRTQPNSFSLTTSSSDGGIQLLWMIYHNNGSQLNNLNYSKIALPNEDVDFQVNIKGSVKCANPVGNATCASGKIDRTPEAWSAYGVDSWFKSWHDKRAPAFAAAGGMIKTFQSDFRVGSGQTCTIGNQCNYVTSCQDLPDHGTDPDSPKIYLAWIALQNLSDMFTYLYQTMNIGELDTLTQIQSIALQFHSIKVTPPPQRPPLGLAAGILGTISALFGLVPVLGTASAALGAISGTIGVVNTEMNMHVAPTAPDHQFADNAAELSSTLGIYTGALRTHLENTYTGIFSNGSNVTSLLSHGNFVNRTVLNLDCNECLPSSQRWIEQYLALKMINYIWWTQNVFITFMPYGKVVQVDSHDETTFDESACASNFKANEPDLVVCNTDSYGWGSYLGPGMARLTWLNPANGKPNEPNGDGSIIMSDVAPGANNSSPVMLNTTGTSQYKFRTSDVVESSLRGFVQDGFNTDNIANNATNIISQFLESSSPGGSDRSEQALQGLKDIFNTAPNAAGMFTLPVCVIKNLNFWPTFFSTPNRVSTNGYCICYTPDSVDKHGKQFNTAAPPDLAHRVMNVAGVAGDVACTPGGWPIAYNI